MHNFTLKMFAGPFDIDRKFEVKVTNPKAGKTLNSKFALFKDSKIALSNNFFSPKYHPR